MLLAILKFSADFIVSFSEVFFLLMGNLFFYLPNSMSFQYLRKYSLFIHIYKYPFAFMYIARLLIVSTSLQKQNADVCVQCTSSISFGAPTHLVLRESKGINNRLDLLCRYCGVLHCLVMAMEFLSGAGKIQ